MTAKRSFRVTCLQLARFAMAVVLGLSLLPNATGCIAYKVYSGIKTAGKVKDFAEDHILKDDDDKNDKNKDEDRN